jgi:hypothetical protein
MGYGARFRRLPVHERARFVKAIERSSNKHLRQLTKVVKGAAFLCYYGDDSVMTRVGYDATANVERARALRLQEGRP